MPTFRLILRNDKLKQYHRLAWFILLVSLAVFLYLVFATGDKRIRYSAMAGSALLLTSLLLDQRRGKDGKKGEAFYKTAGLFAAALAWFLIGNAWIGLASLAVAGLYLAAKRSLPVEVSEQEVGFPSLPRRSYSWEEIGNVVLKDDLLTIDLRNNKLIQQFIDTNRTIVDEKDFNDFCTEQLKT